MADIKEELSSPAITELSDGNDNTCYTNTNLRSVIIVWKCCTAYHFTWMRVVANKDVDENKFTATFKNISDANEVSCNNARQWMVNSKTVEIHCDVSGTTELIILRWDGDISLCSVYISGGRNVALKQTAKQTSTAGYPGGIETSAFKAVDGVTEPSIDHCSATSLSANIDPDASWSLSLSRPQLVYRFVIYNRYPVYSFRLQGFTLTSYNKKNTTIFTYKDEEDPELDVYTIIHEPQGQPVTRVQISGEQHGSFKVVPLCEVEIYGDNTCNPGLYGRDCEHNCNCAVDGETCFVSTGGCPSGCPAGLHGEGCLTECPSKYYGVDCKESCSAHCQNELCNVVNGQCSDGCNPGYQGAFCEEIYCDKGYYGEGCSQQCSQNCADDGSCKPQDGACLHGCKPGFTTPQCDRTCSLDKYGEGCVFNCSHFCHVDDSVDHSNSVCFHVTGVCLFGCQEGYEGSKCEEASAGTSESASDSDSDSGVAIGLGVGVGVLVIIIIIAVVVCIYRAHRRSTGAVTEHPGYEDLSPVQNDPHHYNSMYRGGDGYDLPTELRSGPLTSNDLNEQKYENTRQIQSADVEVEVNAYELPSDPPTSSDPNEQTYVNTSSIQSADVEASPYELPSENLARDIGPENTAEISHYEKTGQDNVGLYQT